MANDEDLAQLRKALLPGRLAGGLPLGSTPRPPRPPSAAERPHHLRELRYPPFQIVDSLRGYDRHPATGFPVTTHHRLAALPQHVRDPLADRHPLHLRRLGDQRPQLRRQIAVLQRPLLAGIPARGASRGSRLAAITATAVAAW